MARPTEEALDLGDVEPGEMQAWSPAIGTRPPESVDG